MHIAKAALNGHTVVQHSVPSGGIWRNYSFTSPNECTFDTQKYSLVLLLHITVPCVEPNLVHNTVCTKSHIRSTPTRFGVY